MGSSSYQQWMYGAAPHGSSYMDKVGKGSAESTRKLLWGLILFPLVCVILLRLNATSSDHHFWPVQLSRLPASLGTWNEQGNNHGKEYTALALKRLVRGEARKQLRRTGITCVYDPRSNFCVTTAAVAIKAGPPRSPTVYLTGGQQLAEVAGFNASTGQLQIQPYPRKTDAIAMQRTAPVNIVEGGREPVRCDVVHSVPAVVFSMGGFAGNFFHDVNEVLIPLFLTAGRLRSRVRLVVTDYESYWVSKYRKVLAHFSAEPTGVVVASSPFGPAAVPNDTVHCFPGAVVGVKYHDNLACNASEPPGRITTLDFKAFLRDSFGLKNAHVADAVSNSSGSPPLLVLLSRKKSRALLNEDEVVQAAKEAGFRVEVAPPRRLRDVEHFAELVNSCSVFMGVHGAGMTNMVFLPAGAVVLQITPLGLDWVSKTYYGELPTARLGLRYVEYKSPAEESTLYQKYPKDHPVLTNPWSIHSQGYEVSKHLYIEGQNVTVDVSRLKGSLIQAMNLLRQPLENNH